MDKDLKILIVDDLSTMRRIIKNMFSDLGYTNTEEADDGQTALSELKAGAIDLLVTGWNMPGMSGLDLLKAVRSDPDAQSLPVLIITAEAKRDQILEAVNAGVDGYVIKPFTKETLKEKVEKILANKAA